MIKFIANEVRNTDNFIHAFECDNDNQLATSVAMFMKSKGYQLVEGTVNDGVFEKGNRTMRILFGAFVKYFKFKVKVENARVHISTGTSGFSGGVIGIGQVKSETTQIADGLMNLQ